MMFFLICVSKTKTLPRFVFPKKNTKTPLAEKVNVKFLVIVRSMNHFNLRVCSALVIAEAARSAREQDIAAVGQHWFSGEVLAS